MWRLMLMTASFVTAAALAATTAPRSAYACTPPAPDYDAVADSDIVVEGRILRYDIIPVDSPSTPFFGLVTEKMSLDVERVHKGSFSKSVIRVVREAWLDDSQQGGGTCSGVATDIKGQYAIWGLKMRDDGSYVLSSLHQFFLGDEPEGERYAAALERVTQPRIVLPNTGQGRSSSPTHDGVMLAAAIAGLTLLGFSLALRRTRP
jgi:hypothetical protein